MAGRELDVIRCERALPPKKLFTVGEPIQGVICAVVGGAVELAELWDA